MHELSLINNLLSKIDDVVRANGGRRALVVEVWLGALSHLSPDRFADYFVEFSRGTVAEGAWLDIEVSEDMNDSNAQQILLRNIEVEIDESE
ncbi:MAG: hydrogenase maturation nickel metallochaperone HypA [Verrucomicrobiales bacterium]|nr:hydrogenase maturation nickel metallochaperone HypA [Verrucomicrobiales bacterium]